MLFKFVILLVFVCQVYANYGVIYVQSSRDSSQNAHYCFACNEDFKNVQKDFNESDHHALVDFSNSTGCTDIYADSGIDIRNKLVAVSRGNCTFVEKARLVQKYKAFGILFVSFDNDTTLTTPGGNESAGDYRDINIVVGLILSKDFRHFSSLGPPLIVWLYSPESAKLDPNMVLIYLIAMVCIVVGAYWSGITKHSLLEKKRHPTQESINSTESDEASKDEDQPATLDVSACVVLVLFIVICGMMVLLYFFYDYLVYAVIGLFCLAGTVGLYSCLCPLWARLIKGDCRIPPNRIPICSDQPEIRNIFLGLLCIGFSVFWAVERKASYAWILQDILGIAFCINMMKTIRLPNLMACTILLVLLFFYDIFFVFITPLFTKNGNSVMIDVATGGKSHTGEQLPMVFKVPRFLNSPDSVCYQRPYSLLGFGDIIVPGLLISFNHGFDLMVTSRRIYFISSTIAYGIGLILTYVALALMETGQPALLYLVPCTLLTTIVIAWRRRELRMIWSGKEHHKIIDDTVPNGNAPSPGEANEDESDVSSVCSDSERRSLINSSGSHFLGQNPSNL